MTPDAAIADAQNRLDTIIAAGHTQFITIRADTVEALIAAAQDFLDFEARRMMSAADKRKYRKSLKSDFKIFEAARGKQ